MTNFSIPSIDVILKERLTVTLPDQRTAVLLRQRLYYRRLVLALRPVRINIKKEPQGFLVSIHPLEEFCLPDPQQKESAK